MNKTTINDITIQKADKNGVVLNQIHKTLHIIGINKKFFRCKYLRRKLKQKYGINIILEEIPNEFLQLDPFNPERVQVQYISWFEYDLKKTNNEMIQEIQKYRRVSGGLNGDY